MIPSNLRGLCPEPQIPWRASQELSHRLQRVNVYFKAALLCPTDPEFTLIVGMADKIPGYRIARITYVYNLSLHRDFMAHLQHNEAALEGNKLDGDEAIHHKILPFWCGTSPEQSEFICAMGFTFCREGRRLRIAEANSLSESICLTDSVQNAALKSKNGYLLLSVVSISEPRSAMSDKPQVERKGVTLDASILSENLECNKLSYLGQKPAWNEFSVFQKEQALPCFVIELAADFLHPPIKPPQSSDLEGYYCRSLINSKRANLIKDQIFILEKLSDIFIRKKDILNGAKILNCALAILKNNPPLERYFLDKLETIEESFPESQGIKIGAGKNNYLAAERAHLGALRTKLQLNLEKKVSPDRLLKELTLGFRDILSHLILSAQKCLGPPPVKWACIGMGSMARNEMCPYSDVEFAFLIEKETPENLGYFRMLTQFIELKIINMGETQFPIFGDKEPSPTPDGFCLDIGGNTPYGNRDTYELIGTPSNLARFQLQEWIDQNIIVSNAMGSVCFVTGDKRLFEEYEKEKAIILNEKKSFFGESHRKVFAIQLLVGHLQEFKPDLSQNKEQQKAFGIKKEIYRPFQEMISCLALFYNLVSTNTLERVQSLVKIGVFCVEGGRNLEKAISQVLLLRLKAHLFYRDEKEFLCHIIEGELQEPELLYLDAVHINLVRQIYRVLIPFCNSFKRFCLTKEKNTLNTLTFNDKSIEQAETFGEVSKLRKVEIASQQALSLNPNNVEALIKLSKIATEFGDDKQGFMRAKKALEVAQKTYGEKHNVVAASHSAIAYALSESEKHVESLEHYQEALLIRLLIYGEEHIKVAKCYYDLAGSLFKLGKNEEALAYYEKALLIYFDVQGAENCNVMLCYNGIGALFEDLGKIELAWEHHEKALSIADKFRWDIGKKTLLVAASYGHIGDFLVNCGRLENALNCYQSALNADLQILNGEKAHPRIAKRHYCIGNILKKMKKYEEALTYYEKALEIFLKTCKERLNPVISCYNVIGYCLNDLKKWEGALESQQKAQKLILKIYGDEHLKLSIGYNNIGYYFYQLGKYPESLEYHKKALNIYLKVYAEDHPIVMTTLNFISLTSKALGH